MQPRHRPAGALLVLGGLLLLAAQLLQPRSGDLTLAQSLAGSPGRWTAWGLLVMASAVAQLPVVLTVMGAVRPGRGARLVRAGGVLTVLSLIALAAFGEAHATLAHLSTAVPGSADVRTAVEHLDSAPSLGVVAVVGLLGFHLGWPVLLAGAARQRMVPAVLAGATAAFVLVAFFGGALGPVADVVVFSVAAALLAVVGLRLVTARGLGEA